MNNGTQLGVYMLIYQFIRTIYRCDTYPNGFHMCANMPPCTNRNYDQGCLHECGDQWLIGNVLAISRPLHKSISTLMHSPHARCEYSTVSNDVHIDSNFFFKYSEKKPDEKHAHDESIQTK